MKSLFVAAISVILLTGCEKQSEVYMPTNHGSNVEQTVVFKLDIIQPYLSTSIEQALTKPKLNMPVYHRKVRSSHYIGPEVTGRLVSITDGSDWTQKVYEVTINGMNFFISTVEYSDGHTETFIGG